MPCPGYLDGPIRAFVERLADPSPEPAGGAALALTAAMAASLVSLAAGAHLAHTATPAERERFSTRGAEAARLSKEAGRLVDGDVAAYDAVTRALALPAGTDQQRLRQRAALDASLDGAADVPLAVAETALEVLHLAAGMTIDERSALRGDLAAARALGEGAVRGALAIARVNIAAVHDPATAGRLEQRARSAERRLTDIASIEGVADADDDAPSSAAGLANVPME